MEGVEQLRNVGAHGTRQLPPVMLRVLIPVVFLRGIKRRREEDLSRDRAREFAALVQSRRGRAGRRFLPPRRGLVNRMGGNCA